MVEEYLEIIRACRRSRVKLRVYGALRKMDVALPAELADAASTTVDRVFAVLHGNGKTYRRETGLVAVGVARTQRTRRGPAYRITPVGKSAWGTVRKRLRRGSTAR